MAIGTTAAILGAIAAGTNVAGGIMRGRAANKAGEIQADQARRSGQEVADAEAGTRGAIFDASNAAGQGVLDASQTANAILDPYRIVGEESNAQLRKYLAEGGDFNKTPTLADLQIDPGYGFRLQQGQLALDRSAAARGGALGGGAIKDTLAFSQGLASQEYQNAFNRFRQTTQDRFDRLNTVAGRGRDVSSEMGGNLLKANEYAGNVNIDANNLVAANTIDASRFKAGLDTDAAAATAAGKVGGSNALWGGIAGGANSALETLLFNKAVNKLAPRGT